MKNLFNTLNFLIFVSAFIVSCNKHNEQIHSTHKALRTAGREKIINYNLEIAKLLAKAVTNERVREIIKNNALKKFDNDYDVLYQMVKNERITDNQSLEEYLISISDSKQNFNEMMFELPLLTFYIPTGLPAEKWDTKKDIPFVVVHDKQNKLIVFNSKGDQDELDPTELPILPLIVVKTNERVITDYDSDFIKKGARINSENLFLSNNTENFYFTDNCFNNINPAKSGGRVYAVYDVDPILLGAFNMSTSCATCYQRDYIYYGISNSQNSGPLNYKFEEAITAIGAENVGLLNQMGGWAEGNFEIRMHGIFGKRNNSTADPINKTANISGEDLFYFHDEIRHRGLFGINTYRVRVTDGVKEPYQFTSPVTFGTWDMEQLGDKYIFDIEEYDDAATFERTYKTTNQYGGNFSINAGVKEKFGFSLGANATTTNETTTVVKTTTGSLPLGTVDVHWTSPVTTKIIETFEFYPPFKVVSTLERNTASIKVSIESVRVQP